MRIGIIGSGNIGSTAARLAVRAGHEVAISHAGPPEALSALVQQLGPTARAVTPAEAAASSDAVLLALPWRERATLPGPALAGKIVIDATNPYAPDFSIYDLGPSTSSEEVAKAIPGARLVKALNTLRAQDLNDRAAPDLSVERRTTVFVAGDDRSAKHVVCDLIESMGFAPLDAGALRLGGRRMQPGGPLYLKPMAPADARARLAAFPDAGAEGLRVQDLMKPALGARTGDTVQECAQIMRERNVGFLPVCEPGGAPVGTVTDRDLVLRVLAAGGSADQPVEAVMTREVVACALGDDLRRAEALMRDHRKSRIMVCNAAGKLVGVISLSDVLDIEEEGEAARTGRGVASREVHQPHPS